MPSIAAHMAVAKLVGERIGIDDPDFIKGNLLPDILLLDDSHTKKIGTYFYVPNLEVIKNNLDLTNKLNLGCYVHFLLDYYFLEDYVPNNVSKLNLFSNGIMYKEYDKINYQLVLRFSLDVERLTNILTEYPFEIDQDKLDLNLSCLSLKIQEDTEFLKFESFAKFLESISEVISKEVEEYANKPNKLHVCTRQ